MLPKVANQLFHHTSRAVAAVQNQTGYTFRNVLQFQSSSGPSSAAGNIGSWNGAPGSNSGWNGTGSGGAKSHSGQRFYSGYTGAGRVVTQADSSVANSSGQNLADDSDDVSPQVIGLSRVARRNSFSAEASSRTADRRETANVLRRAQFSLKPRHMLTERAFNAKPESALLPKLRGTVLALQSSPSPVVRFESTLAVNIDALPDSIPPPLPRPVSPLLITDADKDHALDDRPPTPPLTPVSEPTDSATLEAIAAAQASGSYAHVRSVVIDLLARTETPTRAVCDAAVMALAATRLAGEPTYYILRALSAFIARKVRPSIDGYGAIITALCSRDAEVRRSIENTEQQLQMFKASGITEGPLVESEQKRITRLKAETNVPTAFTMFQGASSPNHRKPFKAEVYSALLQSCAQHGNVDASLYVFARMERMKLPISPRPYADLITVYGNAQDLEGAKEVFLAFKKVAEQGQIYPAIDTTASSEDPDASDELFRARTHHVAVYNSMIDAFFKCGDPAGALGLLEQMLDSPAGLNYGPTDVPLPASSTLCAVVKGFCRMGDVPTALKWFEKLLTQEARPMQPYMSSLAPTRPDQETWDTMLNALTVERMVEDLNRLYSTYLTLAYQDGLALWTWRREMVVLVNLHHLDTHPTLDAAEAVRILDFLLNNVLAGSLTQTFKTITPEALRRAFVDRFTRYGRADRASILESTLPEPAPVDTTSVPQTFEKGFTPRIETIGRLISTHGRAGEISKVRELYQLAQTVLHSLEGSKERQSAGWFLIEDSMIIGLAHAGDVDAAHVHRTRILEQGGVPSADAYGALIHHVKDTTDDTSNAMALYRESQMHGVLPNIYLYNTIISKLAKARKADSALELFNEMKSRGVVPTSVTYGAVIAACCRVGDAESAEHLFGEMIEQSNFKPRVPPFNTMMQLYTQTKPNRERVLFYYNALRNARVQPTAHTYKLLLDAYGSIEPVDTQAMEETFAVLQADHAVTVQGTHWAALINSYGCVQKDLDKALSVFNSIATHPSTRPGTLPDAVVFEALFNVLVTLRRTDLLEHYIGQLSVFGVHMTAYIANLLIKGYASSGDMDRARAIFESLLDPPQGVAARHNHGRREGDLNEPEDLTHAPVYREPSTWEAMVRAELGNGDRDRALALLARVQTRQFPAPVYQRISGILLDESVSPWA